VRIDAPKDYTLAHAIVNKLMKAVGSEDWDDPWVMLLCGRLVVDGGVSLTPEEEDLCRRLLPQ
jgi:hypothetical protein